MTTVHIQSLTFSTCHITGSSSTCTVAASAKTGHSVFATTTVDGVSATVTCLGIPCTFTGAGAGQSVTGSNIAGTNRIAFTNVALNASGGLFCGTSGQETVTYAFTDDNTGGAPVFITSS
ncbi:hypothetical protein [Baekduia sp.]|uniref:hypothetical protein n=1 Tax=Baekduia sp. TaxID=2600305 RepID=UPI002E033FDB|nr:hypothetical protein [Baekduia sp.]